jgi:probable dihydroxyacetone kinase regulator
MSLLTEKALAASLKKLLEKKTLDKITVKDITDDCGVNRQTFYYHFHDVYDLVEWIFTQEAKKYISDGITEKNWQEVIADIMSGLLEEKAFIMNAYYSLNRRQLEQFMQSLARPAINDLVMQVAESRTIAQEDIDFVVDIFTFGLVGILTEWVAGGMNPEIKEKLDKFFFVIDGTLEITLDKFVK